MDRVWNRETRRFIRVEKSLSFDDVVKEDVPTIFTPLQHKLFEIYRDGATNAIAASDLLNVSPNTEKGIRLDINSRMKNVFGKTNGEAGFARALGVAIIAGWVAPKEDFTEINELESNMVDLMLYGFSHKEISGILLMKPKQLSGRINSVQQRVGARTDLELVAIRASSFRKKLLALRPVG